MLSVRAELVGFLTARNTRIDRRSIGLDVHDGILLQNCSVGQGNKTKREDLLPRRSEHSPILMGVTETMFSLGCASLGELKLPSPMATTD
jgi:hypothetical protein